MDPGSPASSTITSFDFEDEKDLTFREFIEIDHAIQIGNLEFLKKYVMGDHDVVPRVNLCRDPVLNVMIAYGSKTDTLVLQLIRMMPAMNLMAKNDVGDTALHVAAAKDNLAVATTLIEKNQYLLNARNDKFETPILKAALFGSAATFRMLRGASEDSIYDRTSSGANVLHCAILGNNPDIALEIAKENDYLMYTRDSKAVTPLQLIMTLPRASRNSLELGPVGSFLYTFIPSDTHDDSKERENYREDEELGNAVWHKYYWVVENPSETSGAMSRREVLKKYQRIWQEVSLLLESQQRTLWQKIFKSAFTPIFRFIGYCLDALRVRHFIISILKRLFKRVEELQKLKNNHEKAMKLVAHLAKDPAFWDFFNKGMFRKKQTEMKPGSMIFYNEIDYLIDFDDDDDDDEIDYRNAPLDGSNERTASSPQKEKDLILEQKYLILEQKNLIMEQNNLIRELTKQIKSSVPEPSKSPVPEWPESPLIVGTKMGLYDFVAQILKVYPQSVRIKDLKGRNVLQVAVKHGREKIAKIIVRMIIGPNPVISSQLLLDTENDKMNTILHYAAETTIKDEGFVLQMQREIEWFETVKKWVPKDMEYSRNIDGKTAQELFNENHRVMVKSGRDRLMEIGKTCSGLLAAVVFATSFNIPGGKDSGSSSSGPSNNNNSINSSSTDQGNHSSDQSLGFKVFGHVYVIGLSFATCSLLLFLSLLTSNYKLEAFRKSLPTKSILAGASFFFALLSLLVAFTCNMYLSIYGGGAPKAKDLIPLIFELTGFPFLCTVALFLGGFGLRILDFILGIFYRT